MQRHRGAIRKAAKRAALHVVPHPDNGHLPHLLRNAHLFGVVAVAALIFAGVALGIPLSQRAGLTAAVYSSVLVDLTNEAREREDIPALAVSPALERAALLKAKDMAEKGYFAHTSPEGLTPWHWFDVVGYRFKHAGENLAVDFDDTEDVQEALLDSPTHRANILNVQFTEIGIATYEGTHRGRDTTFVVEAFGAPSRQLAAATLEPPQAAPAPEAEPQPEEAPAAVLGDSAPVPAAAPAPRPTPVRILYEDPALAIVENVTPGVEPLYAKLESAPDAPVQVSTWGERFLMNPTPAATGALSALAFLVLAGTVATASHQDARGKHGGQIIRGAGTVALLLLLIAAGQAFAFPSLSSLL